MKGIFSAIGKGQMTMETVDIKSLVAFGKLGMDLAGSRILSLCALAGVVAISAYSVYDASWQGAVCTGIVALCFWASVRVEAGRKEE